MTRERTAFLALIAAEVLFLWMFFAADAFTSIAGASRVAAEWRHGMGGGWPFYMPGFFALTLAIAWWWRTRTWRRRLQEGLSAFVIASVFALVLTPLAAQSLERLLEARGIVGTETVAQNVSWATLLRAGLTIVAWTLFVGCGVLAVQRRRPLILLGAVPGFVVLHLVRVGEAGSLIQDWTARAGSAAPAAWLTVALIPLTAWAVGMIAISRPQS